MRELEHRLGVGEPAIHLLFESVNLAIQLLVELGNGLVDATNAVAETNEQNNTYGWYERFPEKTSFQAAQ